MKQYFLISNSTSCFDLTVIYFAWKEPAMLQQSVSVTCMYVSAPFLAVTFEIHCWFHDCSIKYNRNCIFLSWWDKVTESTVLSSSPTCACTNTHLKKNKKQNMHNPLVQLEQATGASFSPPLLLLFTFFIFHFVFIPN